MAVALVDHGPAAVELAGEAVGVLDDGGPGTQAHRAAHHCGRGLRQEDHHGVLRGLVELRRVRGLPPELAARELDDGGLQTDADAEVRDLGGAAVACGRHLALDASVAEAAGHQHALRGLQHIPGVLVAVGLQLLGVRLQGGGVDPEQLQLEARLHSRVLQRLHDAGVGVRVAHVLAHESDDHLFLALVRALGDDRPVGQPLAGLLLRQHALEELHRLSDPISLLPGKAEVLADQGSHLLLGEEQGHPVQVRDVVEGDHGLHGNLAEERQLFPRGQVDGHLGAAHEDVGLQAGLPKDLHRVLARLRLLLPRGPDDGHHAQVDHQEVLLPDPELELLQGLKIDGALDVADRASELHQADLRSAARAVDGLLGHVGDPLLDGVGDVGHHLNGLAEVLPHALLLDDVVVHLARGDAVGGGERELQEPLVVPEVKIGLAAVLKDVDLAVLEGAHRARVDVEIRVDLDRGDADAV
mmetsp:Transcript_1560/g.3042  ORF Transcript_1560/g.3042 Transcript_1560/m.3042 type:complete len:470 (-) Transcript_1560:240-1649(-)